MANTSLAKQLQRLAVPQTSILSRDRKRASLLFEPKDASNLDLETVLEIGLSGLHELQEIGGPEFNVFEKSLFDLTSVGVERAVLTKDVNDLLDEKINRFLALLSPYVLLKPAHRALEWLIQRFHIQEYNRDAFIFLFLPYHETKIFVRAIQLVNLSRESDNWHWLAAVNQSGSPISRGAVINHAASNNSFLAGLCDYVLFSVKVHKSEPGILSSLFAFYCTTLIGAVEGVKKKRKGGLVAAKEAQLQVILPCILKGLSSSVPDFASASFMIVSSLARNAYLGLTLIHKIMNKITKNCHSESVLIKEVAILLAVICETQSSVIVNILPLSAVKKLLKNGVAISIIKELASVAKEVFIDKVSLALLAGVLPLAKSSPGSDDLAPVARNVLDALISILIFEKDTAKEAIRFFVNSLIELMEKEKEDKDSCDPEFSAWINDMLKSLENKYPTAFDAVVQRIISKKDGVEDAMMTSVLGRILGLSVNREEYSGLMERLCHSDEGIRAAALHTLADMDVELFKKKEDLHSFVWVMEKRLQDDSPQVVLAVLSLKFLDSIIERDVMIKELILLLARSMERTNLNTNKSLSWFDVILSSVKMLLSYGCEIVIKPGEESESIYPLLEQKVKILLAVLPLLFPYLLNEVTLCKEILKLSCSDPLLKGLWKELEGTDDVKKISSSVFDYLMNLHLLAHEEGIIDSDLVKVLISCGSESPRNPVVQFMSLIILSGMVSSLTPDLKSTILKFSIDVFENAKATVVLNDRGNALPYKITAKSMDLCLSFAKKGYLPLQALLHSFSAVFLSYDSSWFSLDSSNASDWWSIDLMARENKSKGSMQLAIQIFDILISGCFLGKENNSFLQEASSPNSKKLYISCLKDFFQAHLPSIQHQLKFLSCLWVAHEVPVTVDEALNTLIDVIKDTMKSNEQREYKCLHIASTCKIAVLPKLQVMALCLGESLVHSTNSPISWLLEPEGPGASIIPSALIACSSPLKSVRIAAIKLLRTVANSVGTHLSKGCLYVPLLKELVLQSEEIVADQGQLSLFLYMHLSSDPGVLVHHSGEKKKQMANVRDALFSLLDPKSPAPRHIIRALLHLLYGVRSLELLKKLSPLGMSLIEGVQTKLSLDEYAGDTLLFIINRFDDCIAASMADASKGHSNLWNFFQKSLSDTHTKISLSNDVKQLMLTVHSNNCEEICPSILAMQQVTKEFFDGLPSNVYRAKTLSLLLDIAAQKNITNSVSVAKKLPLIEAASSVAKSAIKRLTLDAELIVEELSKMLHSDDSVEVAPKTRHSIQRSAKRVVITLQTLQSQLWTRGVTLLEITQTKKKLKNAHKILPILFEILKGCLQLKHQEPVEYTKQLILACALHCLRKMAASFTEEKMDDEEESVKIDEHQFDAETIVQCIRSTQNPHTHRHALLLLSCAAELIPDCVLHNVMAIFAFVGTSMVRQDDEYSFEVITRTIESIVPVLVKVNPKMDGKSSQIIPKLPGGMKYLEGPTVQGTLKVLRVFADAVPDVPTHRRLPLYHKLVETIGWEIGLPQLLLLVIEGQVLHSSGKEKEVDRSLDSRLELVHELARKSPSYALVVCCLRMVQYIKFLPADKEAGVNGKLLWHSGKQHDSLFMSYDYPHIFDVKNRSGNQLRHFKHAVLSILCSILSEPQIVAKLSLLDEKSELKDSDSGENLPADELFQHLIQELLSYIAVVAGELESNPSTRYWKALQQRCHQILEKVNGLLPPSLFLSVVKGLLGHQLNSIQRKAADILNARLVLLLNENGSTNVPLVEEDRAALREILLKPLMDMMDISEDGGDETENPITKDNILNCQVALLTAKLLIRILGSTEKSSTLKPILVRATKVASNALQMEEKSSATFGSVLASAALCIAEICSVLKVKVIGELQNFMPVLLSALGSPVMENISTSAVKIGVVTALQRVVESTSQFLSPYLRPLLVRLCLLACKHVAADVPETSKESKGVPISMRLSSILNKVALAIPLRVLIPAVNDSFKILSKKSSLPNKKKKRKLEEESDHEDGEDSKAALLCRNLESEIGESVCLSAIIPLMDMFSHNLSEMSHEDIASHLQELELFFLSAMDLRVEREGIEEDAVTDKAEESILEALVKLVLKLSEASFRPLFYRLFEWTSQEGASPLRAITFYRLSSKLAEALKGLFVLFAGNFIRHAANLLDKNNLADIGKKESEKDLDSSEEGPEEDAATVVKTPLFFGSDDESGFKSHTLIKHILSTLGAVFLYDGTGQFVTRIRFETLMLPLVNQLENLVGGLELFQERCSSNLVPTLVQLAVSSADDSLWKQLNYQILLKTRHSNPKVRLAGLSALLELGKQLGEDFLPLLPETVPFLAELMEDEEEEVETATQSALNVLSDVLGEPLQKYF